MLRDTRLSKQFKSVNSGPLKLDVLKFEENWASSLSSKFQWVNYSANTILFEEN